MPDNTPMDLLAEALRNELLATRARAEMEIADVVRALHEDPSSPASRNPPPGEGLMPGASRYGKYQSFERTKRVKLPRKNNDAVAGVEERIAEYAEATGVPEAEIWLGVAERWLDALRPISGGAAAQRARARRPRSAP